MFFAFATGPWAAPGWEPWASPGALGGRWGGLGSLGGGLGSRCSPGRPLGAVVGLWATGPHDLSKALSRMMQIVAGRRPLILMLIYLDLLIATW